MKQEPGREGSGARFTVGILGYPRRLSYRAKGASRDKGLTDMWPVSAGSFVYL